jgi:hypothetical protein
MSTTANRNRHWIRCLLEIPVLTIGVIALLAITLLLLFRAPLARSNWPKRMGIMGDAIKTGMTQSEVESAIGVPNRRMQSGRGPEVREVWSYDLSRDVRFQVLFDETETVNRVSAEAGPLH